MIEPGKRIVKVWIGMIYICKKVTKWLQFQLSSRDKYITGGQHNVHLHLADSVPAVWLRLLIEFFWQSCKSRTASFFRRFDMKKLLVMCMALIMVFAYALSALAAGLTHTVEQGDTMWKLAVKYQVGISEMIRANPQISNPDLIYPGQVLTIPQGDLSVLEYENEVIRLVNEIRVQNGLKPLTANWELSRVARYKSQDMVDNRYFSHTSPVYGSPFQMIRNFGLSFRRAGENIAYGQRTPQAVVNAWMNSSGHRANILNASYTQIGVGYVANGHYWTQMFIG